MNTPNGKVNIASVGDLINHEYLDYSNYVLKDRAIPSFVDGLKPSTRKVLFTAIKKARSKVKTISLVGDTISTANYHHGDASLGGAIVTLTAEWANNLPLLSGEGSFGDRFNNAAAAARYTSIKLSPVFDKYFLDNEILPKDIDPENAEPQYYLPIIPWVLVNGTSGIAIGYASDILPRKPSDLIKACQKVLEGKPIKDSELPPWFASFHGRITKGEGSSYILHGNFKRLNSTEVLITEIPMKFEREGYVKHLDHLEEKDKINGYTDRSSKKGFEFLVKFARGKMPADDATLEKLLNLTQSVSDNLTVIDENDNLRVYDSVAKLVTDFVAFRTKKVKERFEFYVERDTKILFRAYNTIKFLDLVLAKKIELGAKKKDLIAQVMQKTSMNESEAERVISLPIYSLTAERRAELAQQAKDLEVAIQKWKKANPSAEYLNDLKDIK